MSHFLPTLPEYNRKSLFDSVIAHRLFDNNGPEPKSFRRRPVSISIHNAENGVDSYVTNPPKKNVTFEVCKDVETVREFKWALPVQSDFTNYNLGDPLPEWVPLRRGFIPMRGKETRKKPNFDGFQAGPCRTPGQGRNYNTDPVLVWKFDAPSRPQPFDSEDYSNWKHCDVPCAASNDKSLNTRYDGIFQLYENSRDEGRKCDHQYLALGTMESDVTYPEVNYDRYQKLKETRRYDFLATTDFRSDIPLGYFSWDEYDLGRKVFDKRTDGAHLLMAISNCNDHTQRLQWLRGLASAGIGIHSYGGCDNNHQTPGCPGVQRWEIKQILSVRYPFVAALENSPSAYYVTEKLIDAFISGSVPIHTGSTPEQLKHFCPNKKACLNTADYANPAEMAKYMHYLLNNETAYEECIDWKRKGTSREFRTTMDLSRFHSTCRFCVRVADTNRWKYNMSHDLEDQNPFHTLNAKTLKEFEASSSPQKRILRVRERSNFWFHLVFLEKPSPNDFRAQVLEKLGPFSEHWTTHKVRKSGLDPVFETVETEEDFKKLANYDELEAVLFWY